MVLFPVINLMVNKSYIAKIVQKSLPNLEFGKYIHGLAIFHKLISFINFCNEFSLSPIWSVVVTNFFDRIICIGSEKSNIN